MGSHRILLTAGSNAKGQLGIGTYDDAHTFTPCQFAGCEPNQLPDPTAKVTRVACGANHTVLLLRHPDGSTTLWGTGDGERGQLGLGYPRIGSSPNVGPNADSNANLDPTSGPWTVFHELVLEMDLEPQALVAPGARTGTEPSYASRRYRCTSVAAAWETTYVVLARPGSSESDVVLAMGSNAFGALGVGDAEEGNPDAQGGGAPRIVDFDHVFVDSRSRDGASERGVRSLRTTRACVRALYAGPRHVVAQLVVTCANPDVDAGADGSTSSVRSQTVLVGWGASRHGQLGFRPTETGRFVARPTRLPIDVDNDPIVSCALGNQHTVVLHASGRISALGSNKWGQIPSVTALGRICGLGCTWNGTYMQAMEGERRVLLSMGNNAQGQLGRDGTAGSGSAVNLPVDRAISSFVCGSEHVLAAMSSSLQDGNSVVGWGWNEHGNLGLGSVGNVTIPMQLWPREDVEGYNKYPQRVINIWAGCATSWLLVE